MWGQDTAGFIPVYQGSYPLLYTWYWIYIYRYTMVYVAGGEAILMPRPEGRLHQRRQRQTAQ